MMDWLAWLILISFVAIVLIWLVISIIDEDAEALLGLGIVLYLLAVIWAVFYLIERK